MDPVSHDSFSTRTPEQAHELIRRVWGGVAASFSGDATGFRFTMSDHVSGDLGLSQIDYSMHWRDTVDTGSNFSACYVASGTARHRSGTEDLTIGPGSVGMLRPGEEVTSDMVGLRVFAMRMPLAEVARVAAERGGGLPTDFAFLSMGPVSEALGRAWGSTLGLLGRHLAPPSPLDESPLLRATLVDHLAATALSVFPNTTMTQDQHGVPADGPVSLRRALDYIDEHAAEPLTITDIAHGAGVAPRSLQETFRRHLGTTPLARVRQVRLHRARDQLLAGTPVAGDVSDIARHWGFGRTDRFAAAYRAEFGESPRQTLLR